MKILFEQFSYKTEELSLLLGERYYYNHDNTHSRTDYVGYHYNPNTPNGGDIILILPKVFIAQNGRAFGKYIPDELLSIDSNPELKKKLKIDKTDVLLFEISTWLYRSIQQFKRKKSNSQISELDYYNEVVSNLDEESTSELDIILSLISFYNKNKDLITYILKTKHSQYNKISWPKTISNKKPFLQDGIPIYSEVISKGKSVNSDEELLVLLVSTLYHIKERYAFNLVLNENFSIIKGRQFDKLLIKGTRVLKRIKYKYFSDKLLSAWGLLYTYFERSEATLSKKKKEEVLLVKNFNIVFEDMIDELISDTHLFEKFKWQKDGKELDHIYKYKSLILQDDIYFVGDSKYYKTNNEIRGRSIAKQYTYAKNIIQYNIDLFNKGRLAEGIRYIDKNVTEGYNITPNFFIAAFVAEDLNFKNSYLSENGPPSVQYHFENRLFDRDTLVVQSYNINFLFVLSAYITTNKNIKEVFRNDAKVRFRTKLLNHFNEHYNFYKVSPKPHIGFDSLVSKYFRVLNGKMYRPSQMQNEFILAIEKNSGVSLLNDIGVDAIISPNFLLS